MIITPKNTFEPNREYALRIVKDNIINMEIKPGSLIGEQEIATQLGISRTRFDLHVDDVILNDAQSILAVRLKSVFWRDDHYRNPL